VKALLLGVTYASQSDVVALLTLGWDPVTPEIAYWVVEQTSNERGVVPTPAEWWKLNITIILIFGALASTFALFVNALSSKRHGGVRGGHSY
jgi:hypothetical protein